MVLPQLLAALEQVVQTGLVQSVVAAIRRPPVAHEHAGVVGPQHRGGIVEPPAGADGVDRRVRGDERPQPVADAADAPAGLVRRDHGRVANLLAQLRVGRRGGAGRPVQHVGEAARHRHGDRPAGALLRGGVLWRTAPGTVGGARLADDVHVQHVHLQLHGGRHLGLGTASRRVHRAERRVDSAGPPVRGGRSRRAGGGRRKGARRDIMAMSMPRRPPTG